MHFSIGFYVVGLVLFFASHAFAERYAKFNVELQGDIIDLELRVDGSVGREFNWWILEIEDSSSEFMQVMSYSKPHDDLDQMESNQDFISKWPGKLGGSYGNIVLSKGIEYKAHLYMGNSYSDEDYRTSSSVQHCSLRFSLENTHSNFEDDQLPHIRFLQEDMGSADTSSNDSTNYSDSSDTTHSSDTSTASDGSDSTDTSTTSDGSGLHLTIVNIIVLLVILIH
jgi:hypothetical protein